MSIFMKHETRVILTHFSNIIESVIGITIELVNNNIFLHIFRELKLERVVMSV